MVLDLLSLIRMANLEFVTLNLLKLFFQPLLLIREGLECENNLLNFTLSLLECVFKFLVLVAKAVSFSSMTLLISRRILYLTILDLYELSQILVLFLKSLVLLRDRLLLLLGLHDASLVVLLLLTKLRDLLLQIAHELIFLTDHVGNGLLAIEEHVVLLISLIFEFCKILCKVSAIFP